MLVLQITDTHLFPERDATLLGVCTQASLDAVLDAALGERRPDLIVATGDLAQIGHVDSYRNFIASVRQRYAGPLLCVPGNHDTGREFTDVLPTAAHSCAEWTVVGVDTHVDDEVGGSIAEAELARLERDLEGGAGYLLVVGHHAPINVDTTWLDEQRIDNGAALLALLSRYNVRGYVFGHVHQVFDRCVDGVRLLASPSTCFQFAAGSSEFGIDPAQPGYRWLELGADGTLSTSVGRLQNYELKLDLTDTQY